MRHSLPPTRGGVALLALLLLTCQEPTSVDAPRWPEFSLASVPVPVAAGDIPAAIPTTRTS